MKYITFTRLTQRSGGYPCKCDGNVVSLKYEGGR